MSETWLNQPVWQQDTLLSQIDWSAISRRTARELSNREVHAPVVSTYRWWARRPHSVMGAILDVALDAYGDAIVIADPFSGGGTVTFEAARRGLKIYAQDLYPWPTRGLTAALRACDADDFVDAANRLLKALHPMRAAYCTHAGTELSHIIRVRVSRCGACKQDVFEFPHALVSVASRSTTNTLAYFGCRACGTLSLRNRTVASFTCDGCGERTRTASSPAGCPHCAHVAMRPASWKAVLVQELVLDGTRLRAKLRPAQDGDPVAFEVGRGSAKALAAAIASGKETKRLIDNGFVCWGDLYTKRQSDALVTALRSVASSSASLSIKDRLAFSILGAAEMPALLSRWDRFHLKAFEGMANHRYTQSTLAVESNLLSPVGRGTLPRRLKAAVDALVWLNDVRASPLKISTTYAGARGRKRTNWDVLIATGSSVRQELQNAAVNVILTDPPYFDDVQYGELARLFHAWLSIYDASITVDEAAEAAPNSVRGTRAVDYEETIAACLTESRRTLKPDGRLVLTFHNTKIVAWRALAGAIAKAGFQVSALAAVLAENRSDHCKRNVNAMLHDLVIECTAKSSSRSSTAQLMFHPSTSAEKNLAAVGLALAHCAQKNNPDALRSVYESNLKALGSKKRLIQ